MLIENKDGLTIIYAEGTNKITDSSRTFFTDYMYLAKNDLPSKYEEVSKDIWKNFVKITDPDLEDLKGNLKTLDEKVDSNKTELDATNLSQDEMILSSMDAIAENYETSLTIQDINNTQDELILSTMESVADSYEQMLNIETTSSENQNNVLISMDAIAELYETVLNLQMELESLKGGDSSGNSNSDNIL